MPSIPSEIDIADISDEEEPDWLITFHLLSKVPPRLSSTYLYFLPHRFFVLVTYSGIQMQISTSSSSEARERQVLKYLLCK